MSKPRNSSQPIAADWKDYANIDEVPFLLIGGRARLSRLIKFLHKLRVCVNPRTGKLCSLREIDDMVCALFGLRPEHNISRGAESLSMQRLDQQIRDYTELCDYIGNSSAVPEHIRSVVNANPCYRRLLCPQYKKYLEEIRRHIQTRRYTPHSPLWDEVFIKMQKLIKKLH